ncbi:MAG: hypothetical protein ACK4K7_15635 [Allosphingosinicella sp.]|uniref:hypothetical protein n=1 Tax=Allosphingosinicella sp. TaxID=2823234 RepID=UPI00393CAAA3
MYIDGKGSSGWVFVEGAVPADALSFTSDQRSLAWSSIRREQSGNALCIVGEDGAVSFGVPSRIAKGVRFACGTGEFEVADCAGERDCSSALIRGAWRTGEAPNLHRLPIAYSYHECFGILSISFHGQSTPLGVGDTLELRQGAGLLSDLQREDCRKHPIAQTLRRSGP